MIEELRLLRDRYGVRRFSIIDDEFTLNKHYATRFSEALVQADLGLKWNCPVGVRLDSLYPELLQVMEAAGCENLAVGIESGNQRIQELIKKKVTVETIREKAAMISGCSDIQIVGYFMTGFLDETEEEIRDTIKLASELGLRRANFNVVIPIPGTALFDEVVEQGLLKVEEINWDTLTSDQIAFKRKHVTGKHLLQLQQYAYLRFYGSPRIIWDVTREVLKNREVLKVSLKKLKMLSWRKETYSFTPMYLREKFV